MKSENQIRSKLHISKIKIADLESRPITSKEEKELTKIKIELELLKWILNNKRPNESVQGAERI